MSVAVIDETKTIPKSIAMSPSIKTTLEVSTSEDACDKEELTS